MDPQQLRSAELSLNSANHDLAKAQNAAKNAQTNLDKVIQMILRVHEELLRYTTALAGKPGTATELGIQRTKYRLAQQEIAAAQKDVADAQERIAVATARQQAALENYKAAASLPAMAVVCVPSLPLAPEDPLRAIKNTMCRHPVTFGGRTWSRLSPKIRRQVLAHVLADALYRRDIARVLQLIDAADFHRHCMFIHLPSCYINVAGKAIKLKTLSGHVLVTDSAEIYSALEKRGVDYLDVLRGAGSVLANPRRQWCPVRKISYVELPPAMKVLALSYAETRIHELAKTNAALGDPGVLMKKIDPDRFCSMLVDGLFAKYKLAVKGLRVPPAALPDKVLDLEIKYVLAS